MELNPNHPVTQSVSEHWNKLCALAVQKAGGHVVISMADVRAASHGLFITVQELEDGIHLRLVDEATAKRMAREQGGLPI